MMTKPKWLTVLLFALGPFAVSGCKANTDLSRTVRPHSSEPNTYFVYYKYFEVLEQYGPGIAAVRAEAAAAENASSRDAIWENVMNVAVKKYLVENSLIPQRCSGNIEMLESQADEGGNGTSKFRCK